jgi:hypothetical protein
LSGCSHCRREEHIVMWATAIMFGGAAVFAAVMFLLGELR